MFRCLLLAIVGFGALPASVLAQESPPGACAEYDGDAVSLLGTITLETFPGPPNFSSLYRGDEPISEFVLELDEPLCVKAWPDREEGPLPALAGIVRVQAELPPEVPVEAELLARLGERVWLHGRIRPPTSRYHYLPVLLEARRMTPAGFDRPTLPEVPGRPELPTTGHTR